MRVLERFSRNTGRPGPAKRVVAALAAVAAMVALGGVVADDALAKREKPKPQTKKVSAVGQWAFKRLNKTHELLAAEKYGEALQVLAEMKGRSKLNDHERALMWQTYGYVYSSQEKYRDAATAFEKCLGEKGLPDAAQLNTQYNLAQLYVMLEKYKKAITLFKDWIDKQESPAPEAHYMYAVALTQDGQVTKALPEAKAAVTKSPLPKEAWLQLLLSLYFEKKQYKPAVGVLEQLVSRFPKKTYWMQLSAVYSEIGNHKKALSSLELAYSQGLLTQDSELTNLAQLYLFNEIPYKAAKVLKTGLDAGTVKSDADAWELLANSWLHARERDKALRPLAKAASLSKNGRLWVRLAQVEIDQEKWAAARSSLGKALKKGGLRDTGNAYLLLGIANVSDEKWDGAKEAFAKAAKFERHESAASQWLDHVANETAQIEKEKKAAAAAEAAEEGDGTAASEEENAEPEKVAKAG